MPATACGSRGGAEFDALSLCPAEILEEAEAALCRRDKQQIV
jgi:hypothetical protein